MQKNGAGLHTASSCFWDNTTDGELLLTTITINIYRPQTKVGARSYFHRCMSFLLSTGGGGVGFPACITGHMTGGRSASRGSTSGGGEG